MTFIIICVLLLFIILCIFIYVCIVCGVLHFTHSLCCSDETMLLLSVCFPWEGGCQSAGVTSLQRLAGGGNALSPPPLGEASASISALSLILRLSLKKKCRGRQSSAFCCCVAHAACCLPSVPVLACPDRHAIPKPTLP